MNTQKSTKATLHEGQVQDHLLSITKGTIDQIRLHVKERTETGENLPAAIASDMILLYVQYAYTSKWQKSYQCYCTTSYAAKSLGWTEARVRRAKGMLKEVGLIEDIQKRGEDGKVQGHYVKFRFFIQEAIEPEPDLENSTPWEIPQGGKSTPKCTRDNNGNAPEKYRNAKNTPLPPKGEECLDSPRDESVEIANPASKPTETSAGPPAAPREDDLARLFKAYHPRIKRQPDRTIVKLWKDVVESHEPTEEEIEMMVRFAEAGRTDPKGKGQYCCGLIKTMLRKWPSQILCAQRALVSEPPENDMTPYKTIIALYGEFQAQDRNNWCVAPIPTEDKRAQLRKIWKEDLREDLEYLRNLWQRCSDCKQLSRNEDFGKFFHLTWIFEGDHFSKLMEGRYDNK